MGGGGGGGGVRGRWGGGERRRTEKSGRSGPGIKGNYSGKVCGPV